MADVVRRCLRFDSHALADYHLHRRGVARAVTASVMGARVLKDAGELAVRPAYVGLGLLDWLVDTSQCHIWE